jgi:hypothetical protein
MITRVINGIHYSLQISERMKIRRGGKKTETKDVYNMTYIKGKA